MMRSIGVRRWLLPGLASLLLVGCSSILPPPRAAVGTPERACEDAADADPNVHELYVRMATASDLRMYAAPYQTARANFIRQCVRVRAGLPPGGVEPVQQ
jgi:hypothetical protein